MISIDPEIGHNSINCDTWHVKRLAILGEKQAPTPTLYILALLWVRLKAHTSAKSTSISEEHADDNIFTTSTPPPDPQSRPLANKQRCPPSASCLLLQQTPPFLWFLGLHQANWRCLWAQKKHHLWFIEQQTFSCSWENTTYNANEDTISALSFIAACPQRAWHEGAPCGKGGGAILWTSDDNKKSSRIQLGALLVV